MRESDFIYREHGPIFTDDAAGFRDKIILEGNKFICARPVGYSHTIPPHPICILQYKRPVIFDPRYIDNLLPLPSHGMRESAMFEVE